MTSRLAAICLAAALATIPAIPATAQQMPAMTAADHAYAAGMATMNKSMSAAPMTGNADQDFAAMMLPHHEGAVAMAKTELQYGQDPQLRKMARDIITAQTREIAEFQTWQKTHKPH